MNGRGLLRCPDEKVAHRVRLTKTPATRTPRGSAMLTACDVLDQGQTGTCHAHSAVGAEWTAIRAQGTAPAFVGSPRTLASCTYADVRAAAHPSGALPVLQDTGADLQDDANAIVAWGLSPIQAPTSDGRYSDVENDLADNTFPEPVLGQLVRAVQVTGEYSIPVDRDAPGLVAACLDAGVPVQVGFFCDSAFEALTALDVAGVPNSADPNGGGHATYLYGYRTAPDGSYEFRLRNSWGTSWCDHGDCWVSSAWLLAAWELFPFAVKVSS